jgi:hypothetical protein
VEASPGVPAAFGEVVVRRAHHASCRSAR